MSTTNRRCFNCNYDIADIPRGGRCPECGQPAYDETEVIDRAAVTRYRRRWLRELVIPLAVVTVVALIAFRACRGMF